MNLLDELKKQRMIGLVRHDDPECAEAAARAALKAGLHVVELTTTTKNVEGVLNQLTSEFPDRVLGVGTITKKQEFDLFKRAGAQFFVSPHFDVELTQIACAQQLNYIPGALTPSEVRGAFQASGGMVKVFPADVLGVSGLKAYGSILKGIPLIASGGIDPSNVHEFLALPLVAVTLGSKAFPQDLVESKRFIEIESLWRGVLGREG